MKYKTNTELKKIIESENEDVLFPKKKAATELERRQSMSIDELIYEQSINQSGKLNSINNILVFFTVLTILSVIGTVIFYLLAPAM